MAVDWFGFGYAALVTSGGIIGYAKAGSVPSLAAGLFFGGLAGLGAYQLSQNPSNIWLSLMFQGLLFLFCWLSETTWLLSLCQWAIDLILISVEGGAGLKWLVTSGTLSAIMGTRFYNSRKFMPAGLIAGVSLLMVGRLALKMLEKPQEK